MKTAHKIWSKQEILRLIERYQQFEILWNTKIPQYKNRALKQDGLKELSLEFGTPVSEIQRKVHNLRCQLNSEVKKLKKRKIAGVDDASLKSSWEYFEPLLFILSASSNEDDDMDGIDISDHLETMIEADDSITIKQEEEDDYQSSTHDEIRGVGIEQTDTQIESDLSQDNTKDSIPGCSQLKISYDGAYPDLRRKTTERRMDMKKSGPYKKKKFSDAMNGFRDDCQIFGDFVAAELRNLKNDDNRRKLKRIIQRAILDISESEG